MNFQLSIKLIVCFFFCNSLFAEENFLLINGVTNEVVVEFGQRLDDRISPCSTFKIALSLMGYDAGFLKDENLPVLKFKEGYDDYMESWKASITPQSWMRYSCIWYSKIIALELGVEKIQSYLNIMDYGNKDICGGLGKLGAESVAWINSSLKISPKEQVIFIQKMILGKLPISTFSTQMTKAILFKEELSNGYRLYGKTGWSGSSITQDGKTLEHAWFVGWIENDQNIYPFAYLILDKKINLDQRIPRVKQLLLESGILGLSF